MQSIGSKKPKRLQKRDHTSLHIVSDIDNRTWENFYKIPPFDEKDISIEDFEALAFNRSQLLAGVEEFRIRGQSEARFREMQKKWLGTDVEAKRNDYISHHILRLAYATSDRMKDWFITQECELFRIRLNFHRENLRPFLDKCESLQGYPMIKYTEIQDSSLRDALRLVRQNVKQTAIGPENETLTKTEYLKLPFTMVSNLVRNRSVYIHQGEAFVPTDEIIGLLMKEFRSFLGKALAHLAKMRHVLTDLEGDRLMPMLKGIGSEVAGNAYHPTRKEGSVSINDIDQLSKQSFPLCMRNMHEALRSNHHLKHMGRMQYGLFLKGIGLKLEDALEFWRREFTRVMTPEKFERGYAYNIRHNYGKEGKRTNYTPYSCSKLIMRDGPGPGQHHGCPYRFSDEVSLRRSLRRSGIPAQTIETIIDYSKEQKYQLGCMEYFKALHSGYEPEKSFFTHPNQYFDASIKYWQDKEKTDASQKSKENQPISN